MTWTLIQGVFSRFERRKMEYNTYYLFCKSIGRGTFFSAPNYEEFVEKIRKNGEGESSSSGCRLYSIMRNDVTPDNILSRIKGNDGVYLQGQSCSEAFFFDASFGGFCFPLKPVVTFGEALEAAPSRWERHCETIKGIKKMAKFLGLEPFPLIIIDAVIRVGIHKIPESILAKKLRAA